MFTNLRFAATGSGALSVGGVFPLEALIEQTCGESERKLSELRTGYGTWCATDGAIDFARFAREGAPRFIDVLPPVDFALALGLQLDSKLSDAGVLRAGFLINVLGLTPLEVGELAASLAARPPASFAAEGRKLFTLRRALPEKVAALERSYAERCARAAPVEWWIRDDPGRQYTASRHPLAEAPADWYRFPAAAAGSAPPRAPCVLCREPLADANFIPFRCGHFFHWAPSASGRCCGLLPAVEKSKRFFCSECAAPRA